MEEDEACDFISTSDWSKKRLSRCGDCSGEGEVREDMLGPTPRGDSGSNRCASVGGGREDADEEAADAASVSSVRGGCGCVAGGWDWGALKHGERALGPICFEVSVTSVLWFTRQF